MAGQWLFGISSAQRADHNRSRYNMYVEIGYSGGSAVDVDGRHQNELLTLN